MNMVDLKNYYDSRAEQFDNNRLLEQVGHTECGKPIAEDEFENIVCELKAMLELEEKDVLLDLACGNGVITYELASRCKTAFGVDFSSSMINTANAARSRDNTTYIISDILDLKHEMLGYKKVDKVLIYGALQHFEQGQLASLVEKINLYCGDKTILILGFVPNLEEKWNYYGTFKMIASYLFYKILRRDVMGTWWSKKYIEDTLKALGMRCEFIPLEKGRYGYPYRFHVLVRNY